MISVFPFNCQFCIMSELKYLIATRAHVRSRITKLHDKIVSTSTELTLLDIQKFTTKVNDLQSEITDQNEQISPLFYESDTTESRVTFTEELDKCAHYNEQLGECKSILECAKLNLGPVPSSPTTNLDSVRPKNLKLPELPLPTFSNAKGESLTSFLTKFESILKNYGLSSYTKFVYLSKQLSGPPFLLVDSLQISDQSYESAVALLKQAFASDDVQKFDVIQRLRDLKCGNKPYEFIGEIRLVKDLFTNLKIDVNTVLQFFVWNGLTAELQTQLISICNTNKPSLTQIEENIFKALDRTNELNSHSKRKTESNLASQKSDHATNFAARVSVEKKPNSKPFVSFCSLCSEKGGSKVTSHNTRNCPVYQTPGSKRDRLEFLNACSLCGYVNHRTVNCERRFKQNCLSCNGRHMTFLCSESFPMSNSSVSTNSNFSSNANPNTISKSTSNNNVPKKQNSKTNDKVTSGAVWTEAALHTNVGSDSLLPTFTCQIGNSCVRILKDSGCQPNFIEQNLVSLLSLPTVSSNLDVTVHGFNESKSYKTCEVEVNLVLKNSVHTVRALVVPEIKTELNVPGLGKIVDSFRSKNYELADEKLSHLSDDISNIQFVLGTKDSHVLKENQVEFGKPVPSVFSMTDEGVLLFGDVSRLCANLPHLKEFSSDPSSCARSVRCQVAQIDSSSVDNSCPDDLAHVRVSSVILDDESSERDLEVATAEILNSQCPKILSCETQVFDEENTEINKLLITSVINNTSRADDGRLILPLAWKANVSSSLATNFHLAKRVLKSNEKKLMNHEARLKLMDDAFREQEELEIIERITDDSFFTENPKHSYLAHMGVFKLNRETTKCRIVFLSNLSQKTNHRVSFSHNQVMHAGPSLNQKITTALLHLRFDEAILCFDLKKAFLQISLSELDANKLLFLWYKNVPNKDFSLVTFRHNRLPFGLRCSPFLLTMAMHKILCIDAENDEPRLKNLKRLIYALMYVDNGAVSGSTDDLQYALNNLASIFQPYQFEIQQLVTNDSDLQTQIDSTSDGDEKTKDHVNLLGLTWDRERDKLATKELNLDPDAKTKRTILSTIAKQYDVYGFNAPLLVRARLFMHALQCDGSLGWDDDLAPDLQRTWRLIAKQVNSSPMIWVDRCIGERDGSYELLAYTDASKTVYATVIYLKDCNTNKTSFICAKNKIVSTQLQTKSVPTLELQAVTLGVETIVDLCNELSGASCLFPIKITKCKLFTDSLITLHWLNSYCHKLDKMQKRSVFVLNRLEHIARLCERNSITFSFTPTTENPADCLTRPCSHKQMSKTSYLTGLALTCDANDSATMADFTVTIPDPEVTVAHAVLDSDEPDAAVHACPARLADSGEKIQFIQTSKFSSFRKIVRLTFIAMKFISEMQKGVNKNKPSTFPESKKDVQLFADATRQILSNEQEERFPEVLKFLNSKRKLQKDAPEILTRLNVFLDTDGLLKVRSKFKTWGPTQTNSFPILLAKDSPITTSIIRDAHEQMSHAGCYSVLSHLRNKFWIPHPYSTVKSVLKSCISCKKVNSRSVKLTQNSYRDFRTNPPKIPYRSIFIDYIGPYSIKTETGRKKVWLLAITCLWSRAINLKICSDLTVKSFLRAFQTHIFEYGLPCKVVSDLGSQLVAGTNIIADHLNSLESKVYLSENGIQSVTFKQYFKGNSSLGSLIESCVKLTKRLIYGAIKKNVLMRDDFHFIISQTISLLNKRPVAFKSALQSEDDDLPSPITPEMLVHGRQIIGPNVIPALESQNSSDDEWNPSQDSDSLTHNFAQLQKVRTHLIEAYSKEFLSNLLEQATNLKGRYKPVPHNKLSVGDIVLLKEPHLKATDFPMARVTKVYNNDIGEVTDIVALKGKTRESVKRHVTSVVPLMRDCIPLESRVHNGSKPIACTKINRLKLSRAAKTRGIARTTAMLRKISS